MKIPFFPFVVLTLFMFSCKVAPQRTTRTDLALSSGQSQVIAEIIAISDKRLAEPPCSDTPCFATVKILKVIHLSNSSDPLFGGKEGEMRFVFTLSKTTEALFPNMNKEFSGLKKGDRFRANIKIEHLLGNPSPQWVAYDYILVP